MQLWLPSQTEGCERCCCASPYACRRQLLWVIPWTHSTEVPTHGCTHAWQHTQRNTDTGTHASSHQGRYSLMSLQSLPRPPSHCADMLVSLIVASCRVGSRPRPARSPPHSRVLSKPGDR
jgi:hypothetical protein